MDAAQSKKLGIGVLCLVLVAVCFSAGFLLFPPGPSAPVAATPPAADVPVTLAVAPPDAPPTRKYNVTIETNADWSRAILSDGKFTSGDGGAGLNVIEMTSESPEQVNHFLYSPGEVAVTQKQFATARIVIKAVVETAEPRLEFRLGHGDNGSISISSPVDSFTNDKTLGDGQNFVVGTIRLE